MLIGLTGCKGVGKDTAASCLEGFTRLGFADKLKEAVGNLLMMDDVDAFKDYGTVQIEIRGTANYYRIFTGRSFLQRFGTEMGRETFWNSFWVDQWETRYQELQETSMYVPIVVPDVRFANEAIRIKTLEGMIIRIDRPGYIYDGHPSEDGIPDDLIDAVVLNNGTVEEFQARFLAVVEGLISGVASI